MNTEVEPDDWLSIDPWWSVYTQGWPAVRDPHSVGVLDRAGLDDCWKELDPWWDVYSEVGHETAVEVAGLLNQSNEAWRTSECPFDTDPLAADLTLDRFQHGPLQPGGEVSWSRWLGRLLAPAPALIADLFGVEVSQPPERVVRENQLSKEGGSFRRPDVLVFLGDIGVSIEVKIDDENYRKTAETARLIEQHYPDYEWIHTLLLPKSKLGRLRSIVGPPISQPDETPQVEWDDPGPITVLHWRDITAAARSLLFRDAAVDDHWAANAYLFCAVAEQRLLGFQPQPVVKRMASPANVVDSIQPIQLADTLEEQLTYLRTVLYP